LSWLSSDGTSRGILAHIGERPRLPDPQQLQLTWPTTIREVERGFGADQRAYYDCCHITGGHNGLDLRVDRDAPETSPIVAALDGTVVQVALDEDGYGRHVRVRSYGPRGEQITLLYAHLSRIEVMTGTLVSRGDVLGWAGPARRGKLPHLHFGMRVAGVRLPVVFDWVNPRPYLPTES
jgi:murein DD-endopeptidase MepM/ murein hydrolase activator NlpD